jgi:hypothetical protein
MRIKSGSALDLLSALSADRWTLPQGIISIGLTEAFPMSWWRKWFTRTPLEQPYGLHPSNPVLCGGGVAAEIDYLDRLRCPSRKAVRYQRLGSLDREGGRHLNRPNVALRVSRGTVRRLGQINPHELPLDAYVVVCECGRHRVQVFIDMYFRGPELPIGSEGWTMAAGISPAESIDETASCPYCGEELRTPKAKQCRFCMMDWHDPDNVHRSERKQKRG